MLCPASGRWVLCTLLPASVVCPSTVDTKHWSALKWRFMSWMWEKGFDAVAAAELCAPNGTLCTWRPKSQRRRLTAWDEKMPYAWHQWNIEFILKSPSPNERCIWQWLNRQKMFVIGSLMCWSCSLMCAGGAQEQRVVSRTSFVHVTGCSRRHAD